MFDENWCDDNAPLSLSPPPPPTHTHTSLFFINAGNIFEKRHDFWERFQNGWNLLAAPVPRTVISSLMANCYAKEISNVNIRTRVARAKKVTVLDGLLTIWGFCCVGGRYIKNWRLLYCAKFNFIQPSTKIYVKMRLRYVEFVSFWRQSLRIRCHFGRFIH